MATRAHEFGKWWIQPQIDANHLFWKVQPIGASAPALFFLPLYVSTGVSVRRHLSWQENQSGKATATFPGHLEGFHGTRNPSL